MTDAPASLASTSAVTPFDRRDPLQFLLLMDAGVRVLIWSISLAVTVFVGVAYFDWVRFPWPRLGEFAVACHFAWRLAHLLLLFNIGYLLMLVALRLPAPRVRPGRYSIAGPRLDWNLVLTGYLWVLTKARYQPPFPAFLVPQFANLAPFRWLFNWKFGPHSQSVFFVEPHILDPSLITIGKNVTIGFGATVSGHIQDGDTIIFEPTVIEDDVLIGGHVTLAGGVRVKRGAIIRAYSLVLPGTVIGENEYWAGIPARRVRNLKGEE